MDFIWKLVVRYGMDKIDHNARVEGAQSVDRACALLKEVARAGCGGARILDLCEATNLSRPTVHRILLSLASAGFIRQNAESKRYALGLGLFEIGLAAPTPLEVFPEVTRLLDDIAEATQDTAYLMMRSQDDVVCAWRSVGAFPIKANVVAPGDRRPMAASAGGINLLAAMSEEEADRIVNRSLPYLDKYSRVSEDVSRELIDMARRNGYTLSENMVMEGVSAVGMAVPSNSVQPYLAISVSAISSRITQERLPGILSALKKTAHQIAAIVDRQST